jgi:transglutaminase-like putative cysteine protease
MRIRISHATTYRYDTPPTGATQLLRLTPRNHDGQYIVAWRIDLSQDFLRYIGGHLYRADGVTAQEAGHAWAEAYVENLGWVGFDPANGICVSDAYLRVAMGLDYLGAAPVWRGQRFGGSGESLQVAVHVNQARRQSQM